MTHRRRIQKGGLGPFAQQMAMYSLAPMVTDLASNVLGGILPRLTGQRGAGQRGGQNLFHLPGNSEMIGLPNHLPALSYLRLPSTTNMIPRTTNKQRGRGVGVVKKRCHRSGGSRRKRQRGGLGALAAMAGMTLAPMLLKPLLGRLTGAT